MVVVGLGFKKEMSVFVLQLLLGKMSNQKRVGKLLLLNAKCIFLGMLVEIKIVQSLAMIIKL